MGAANESGGEDNITVVLFTLAEAGEDEDTLSGLEGYRIEQHAARRRSHRSVDGEGNTIVRPVPIRERGGVSAAETTCGPTRR